MADSVTVTETISAPAELVYGLVSDLPHMGEWSPESTGGRWLTPGGPRVGARFLGRNRTGRRRWSTLVTVRAADPGRRFAFRVSAPLVPISDWEFTLEPTETGCRVLQTWTDRRLLPIRLISGVRTGVRDRSGFNRRSMQQTLEAMKAAAESDCGASGASAGSVDWDAIYEEAAQVWSGNPNTVLVAEAAGLTPGTAVDVGCGEGADAIWLAQRGWRVTAFDVSSTALARAADHIASAGVTVEVVHAGLLDPALADAQFDLVNVQYPALLHEQGRSLAALLGMVAPGGTLLFVHHAGIESDESGREGFDPADYVLPPDVHAGLDQAWEVQVYEERPRHVTTGAGARHKLDLVLKARRIRR